MLKPGLTIFGLTVVALATVFGQQQNNTDKQLACNSDRYGDRRLAYKCAMNEQTIASVGQLTVDPGRNGGVSIKGSTRNDVLVRVRTDAWAATDSEASLMLGQVHSDASAGRIAASGPESARDSYWSVSYEIFVPQTQELKVTANNGGISVWDVTGRMDLETKNGGLALKRVVGDITGRTKNGGIQADLVGSDWQGRQLDLETKNGGVNVSVPTDFQAHVQAQTVNGAIRSAFGGLVADGSKRERKMDLNMGAGGASVKLTTVNGGIIFTGPGGVRRELRL